MAFRWNPHSAGIASIIATGRKQKGATSDIWAAGRASPYPRNTDRDDTFMMVGKGLPGTLTDKLCPEVRYISSQLL